MDSGIIEYVPNMEDERSQVGEREEINRPIIDKNSESSEEEQEEDDEDNEDPPFIFMETIRSGDYQQIIFPWLGKKGKIVDKCAKSGGRKTGEVVCIRVSNRRSLYGKFMSTLSAAMVINYYLTNDPSLSSASIGTQVYKMWFPVLAAHFAGNIVGPVGITLQIMKFCSDRVAAMDGATLQFKETAM